MKNKDTEEEKTRDTNTMISKRWWEQLGYLTIEFGLPGFFSFSVLSFSCLSSAQSGSHLTRTPCHTWTPGCQLQCQRQNNIHMAMSSPPPPLCLHASLSLSFSFTTSCFVKVAHAPSHGHSHKHSALARKHTVTPVHAQKDGEMAGGDFAGCWRE